MGKLTAEKKYIVEVVNAYLTENKDGSKPGISVHFSCAEGTIDKTLWFSPAAAERSWQDLETLGFTAKHAEDMENLDKLMEIIGGHSCQITTKDNGQYGLEVQWINPAGPPKSRSTETKAALHARFQQVLKGNSITGLAPRTDGLVSGSRSARPEPPPISPINPSDVPF